MRSISHHIKSLVINSLGRGHTRIPTIYTGSILRNQAHAWFNNDNIYTHTYIYVVYVTKVAKRGLIHAITNIYECDFKIFNSIYLENK